MYILCESFIGNKLTLQMEKVVIIISRGFSFSFSSFLLYEIVNEPDITTIVNAFFSPSLLQNFEKRT